MKKSSLGTNLAPSKTTPITGALNMKIAQMINQYLVYGLQGVKAPNVNLWPGDLEKKTNLLSNVNLGFVSARLQNELISTGYYVPPGVDLHIVVQSMTSTDNWFVQIRLEENSLWTQNQYYRYPISSVRRVLNAKSKLRISSTFGGLLYFQTPKSGSLKVLVSNVVKSPLYNFADKGSINSFNNQLLTYPGVW
jgi:hypothetical protein